MKKVFYGSKSNNICAYCWKHRLALTPKQMKKRKCLKRKCEALEKKDHPMWEKRESEKESKIPRKKRLEAQYREITGKE